MRKIVALLVLAVAGVAAQLPRKAPDFMVTGNDGKQAPLSSYRGRTVVLAVMLTTSPSCQKLARELYGIQADYGPRGAQVLGLIVDPNAALLVDAFGKTFGSGYPVGVSTREAVLTFLDQPLTDNAPLAPILVFIDKSGIIRNVHFMRTARDKKFFDQANKAIPAELDQLLKGGAPSLQFQPSSR